MKELGSKVSTWLWLAVALLGLLTLSLLFRETDETDETDEIVQEALSRGADSHGRGSLLNALRMRRHH